MRKRISIHLKRKRTIWASFFCLIASSLPDVNPSLLSCFFWKQVIVFHILINLDQHIHQASYSFNHFISCGGWDSYLSLVRLSILKCSFSMIFSIILYFFSILGNLLYFCKILKNFQSHHFRNGIPALTETPECFIVGANRNRDRNGIDNYGSN